MWNRRVKAHLILIFSMNTNCESMAYRSFRIEEFSARGVRKVTTGMVLFVVPALIAGLLLTKQRRRRHTWIRGCSRRGGPSKGGPPLEGATLRRALSLLLTRRDRATATHGKVWLPLYYLSIYLLELEGGRAKVHAAPPREGCVCYFPQKREREETHTN